MQLQIYSGKNSLYVRKAVFLRIFGKKNDMYRGEHIVISRQFRRSEQSKWRKQPIKMQHKKRKLPTIADEKTYSFGKCFLKTKGSF